MSRLFPQSLAGRLILWLLASLFVVQLAFTFVQEKKREADVRQVATRSMQTRVVMMARLLEGVEPDQWPAALHAGTASDMTFRVDGARFFTSAPDPRIRMMLGLPPHPGGPDHAAHSRHMFSSSDGASVTVTDTGEQDGQQTVVRRKVEVTLDEDTPEQRVFFMPGPDMPRFPMPQNGPLQSGISIQLDDGRWLNARTAELEGLEFSLENWGPLLLSGLVLALVVITVVHLETRPIKALATAAEQLGRGEKLAPLDETGPKETRAALRAFNQMGDKISRFVGDRTQLLAAMSHDLRTPLTTMRLRVEDIEDEELRDKLVSSIEEMKQMSDATLAFARADAADEPTVLTDVSKLAGCVVAEFEELGEPVTAVLEPGVHAHVRPLAIKRAIRNLIENAVRYGKAARLDVRQDEGGMVVDIEDDGPGIAEADLERVFEPFTRLEASRNRQTGGAGLGLAIARSIIRSHGGELTLHNRDAGGLRARVWLQMDQGL